MSEQGEPDAGLVQDDRIGQNVKLAADITNKVNYFGIARFPRGGMGADLSDIYMELQPYQETVNRFLDAKGSDRV